MSGVKEWDLDMYKRVSKRRKTLPQDGYTEIQLNSKNRRRVLMWLDKFTVGHYYFGIGILTFEDDKEAVMFQLGYKDEE